MADLELWRRHTRDCPKRSKGRKEKKCKCPIWCDGYVNGRRVRESMGTRDWDRAEYRLAHKNSPEAGATRGYSKPLADAIKLYLQDCAKARGLQPSTVISYENTLRAFREHAESTKTFDVSQVSVELITGFRVNRKGKIQKQHKDTCPAAKKRAGRRNCNCPVEEMPPKPGTHRKELETLRGFFNFCVRHKWVPENCAKNVKPPKEAHLRTLPFSPEEFAGILTACNEFSNSDRTKQRALALVWLLVYSGFRISDAAQFKRASLNIETRRFVVRTKKNGEIVTFTLGQPALDALLAMPIENETYFFWSGESSSTLDTCVKSLRRTLDVIRRRTGINVHPHRFRDTFAVMLLEKGTAIRTVQRLLGHQSVRTTEKYYAHWVQSHQALLDEAAGRLDFEAFGASAHDPSKNALGDTKGNIISFPTSGFSR